MERGDRRGADGGFARQFAADWELPREPPQVGNESPSPVSGFQDEKLYWVRRVPDEEARQISHAANGVGPVLRAVKQADRSEQVSTARRQIHQ